jgi:prophage antirepressor-like protein
MEVTKIGLFEGKKIRKTAHHDEWWFSVVDICEVLTGSVDSGAYWRKLKQRLIDEKSQVVTFCHGLKLEASDGKKYKTDCSNTEGILRIVQSIPSPKAEPFKRWLAKVGYERIQEISDPERALNRSREYWLKHGRSEKWIQQRMMGQETRNKLTDYWKSSDVKEGEEFAILTNIIHSEWAEVSVKDHKKIKGLKSQNLRDHMSEAELIFTALAELSTRQIAESEKAIGLKGNKLPAKRGGKIAKDAKLALEAKTGKKVISNENYLPPMLT